MLYLVCYLFFPLTIIIGTKSHKANNSEEWLDKKRTDGLRGIAILFIMLHHITSAVESELPFTMPFVQMGSAGVAVFFLLSGYVHIQNYAAIELDYHFLIKKAKRMLFPYCLIWIIYFIRCLLISYPVNGLSVIKDMVQLRLPGTLCWYFKIQILLYILFYFSFGVIGRRKSIKTKILIMTGGVIFYIIIAYVIGLPGYWYLTVFYFVIGMLIAQLKDSLFNWIRQKKRAILLWVGCFAMFCTLQGMIFFRGFAIGYYPTNILLVISFVGMSVIGLFFFSFESPILRTIGNISLELYLIHGMLPSSSAFPSWDFTEAKDVVIFISLSIILSIVVHKITSYLLHLNKKGMKQI